LIGPERGRKILIVTRAIDNGAEAEIRRSREESRELRTRCSATRSNPEISRESRQPNVAARR